MMLIGEIAQAHDGSLGLAHSYIDALADAGVDVVKFQTHIAHAESSALETFRIPFSYADKTRYDYWKRMEFTPEEWSGLKQHCEDRKVEFMSSPFSIEAFHLLEKLQVKKYKVGSGEIQNFLLLQHIASTGKPLILSTGMSDFTETDETMAFLSSYSSPITLMQCTTAYPTLPADWGLQMIQTFKERYKVPVGFSDHSGNVYAGLAAAALGADVLEFHAVFDHASFGPDAKASLNFNQINMLVSGVKVIRKALEVNAQKDASKFTEMKIRFGKTLSVNRDVKSGDVIKIEDLESRKPGNEGIAAKDFLNCIGKTWANDLKAGDFIQSKDIKS